MRTRDPLIAATAGLLRPRLPRLLLAVTLGVLSLTSALALAGVSAWLITRAWQMPPILDLSVAVVAVRALAISRGVLRYCERLVTHDTALRAAGTAREQGYRRLAHGPASLVTRLPNGELVARLGADVDALSDVLVRAVLPIAVATVLAVVATATIGVISPVAAALLAICLVISGVCGPWLAARAAMARERMARNHLAERDTAAMLALEHAPELRVGGVLPEVIADSQRRQHAWAQALDSATRPAAIATAAPTAAMGVSVLGAVAAAIGIGPAVAPTTLAILMLLPMSAFEANTALPAAAVQLVRSRIAALRLLDLAPAAEPDDEPPTVSVPGTGTGHLCAAQIYAGYDPGQVIDVTVDLPPGSRMAVTGPSGSGKTTLLMTLAGLVPPLRGQVALDGVPLDALTEQGLCTAVGFFAEDAHVFATTVRDNLLVARGDCTDAELTRALDRVGLRSWVDGLPQGLATVLTGGPDAMSAGQRRRLLLARALIAPARIVLLDEPTEHLDTTDADLILRTLLDPNGLFAPERTVVVATHHLPSDIRCRQLRTVATSTLAAAERPYPPDLEPAP